MSPIPKDPPAPLLTEGWHNGHIFGIPVLVDKNTKKGPSIMMTVKFQICVPDGVGYKQLVYTNVFIYDDTKGGGSNWGYEMFLKALQIPDEMMTDPQTGAQIPALPDPDPASYESKPVKAKIYHDEYKGKVRNQINQWDEWDGKDDEGETYEAPPTEEKDLEFPLDDEKDEVFD